MIQNPTIIERENISKSSYIINDKTPPEVSNDEIINLYTIDKNGARELLYKIEHEKDSTPTSFKVTTRVSKINMTALTQNKLGERLIKDFREGIEHTYQGNGKWVSNCYSVKLTYSEAKRLLSFSRKNCGVNIVGLKPGDIRWGKYPVDEKFLFVVGFRDISRNKYSFITFDKEVYHWVKRIVRF